MGNSEFHIIKRNRNVVDFQMEKIVNTITKAFMNAHDGTFRTYIGRS